MKGITTESSLKKIFPVEIPIFLFILAIAIFWTWFFLGKPLDDAYISLRYAENFLQGHGLVFNAGEHVEAYSSYLFEMFVCMGMFLGFSGDLVEQTISVVFYFLIIALLTVYARERFKYSLLYLCVPALFVFSLANNFWTGLALETTLTSFLLLSSIIFYLKFNHSRWQRIFVGLWCCLLSLSRPEAMAYYLVIFVFEFFYQLIINKKISPSRLLEYSVGLIIFLFYIYSRWYYYGYVMPNTYYQKVGFNLKVWFHGFNHLREFIEYNCGGDLIFLLIITYGVLFRRDKSWWLFFLIFLTSSCLVVLSGGNWTPFWRYVLPCSPLLAVLTGDFFEGAFLFAKKLRFLWRINLKLSISFLLCFILVRSSYEIVLNRSSIGTLMGNRGFHATAQLYGLVLKKILSPDQSVALNVVPFFSYYYGGYVYDMLGLTDAKIAHRKVEMGNMVYGHEKGDGFYILAMRPTIIRFQSLPLDDKPITGYPKLHVLSYMSDIEIRKQKNFVRLYEPYNLFIPAARKYINFFKLRKRELKSITPGEIDSIYKNTIGSLGGGIKIQASKNIEFFTNYLGSTMLFLPYRNFAYMVTLENEYER